MSSGNLAGAVAAGTKARETRGELERDIERDIRLRQQMTDANLAQQQLEQNQEQQQFDRQFRQLELQQRQAQFQQEQSQFQEQQQQRQLEAEAQANRAEADRESRELIARNSQTASVVQTAIREGRSVNPETLEQFGVREQNALADAARRKRGLPAQQAAQAPPSPETAAALPLQPGTAVPSGATAFDLLAPGETGQFGPQFEPGAVPSGAGFIRGPGGGITALRDTQEEAGPQVDPDTQAKTDFLSGVAHRLDPSTATAFQAAVNDPNVSLNQFMTQARLFATPTPRPRQTELDKVQEQAAIDEDMIRGVLQTNNPRAIVELAIDQNIIDEFERPSTPDPESPNLEADQARFAQEINEMSIGLLGKLELARVIRNLQPKFADQPAVPTSRNVKAIENAPETAGAQSGRLYLPLSRAEWDRIPPGASYRHPANGEIQTKE